MNVQSQKKNDFKLWKSLHQVASKQKTNDTSVWGKAPCHMNANEKTLLYLVHRSIHCYQIYYILQYYLLLWMSDFFTNQFIWCGVSRCSGGLGKISLCICSIICRAETILQIVKWLNLICERYDAYMRDEGQYTLTNSLLCVGLIKEKWQN